MGTRFDIMFVHNMPFLFPVKIACNTYYVCSILRVTCLQVIYALKCWVRRRDVRELCYKFYSY
jgi:hypothetical protein